MFPTLLLHHPLHVDFSFSFLMSPITRWLLLLQISYPHTSVSSWEKKEQNLSFHQGNEVHSGFLLVSFIIHGGTYYGRQNNGPQRYPHSYPWNQ